MPNTPHSSRSLSSSSRSNGWVVSMPGTFPTTPTLEVATRAAPSLLTLDQAVQVAPLAGIIARPVAWPVAAWRRAGQLAQLALGIERPLGVAPRPLGGGRAAHAQV